LQVEAAQNGRAPPVPWAERVRQQPGQPDRARESAPAGRVPPPQLGGHKDRNQGGNRDQDPLHFASLPQTPTGCRTRNPGHPPTPFRLLLAVRERGTLPRSLTVAARTGPPQPDLESDRAGLAGHTAVRATTQRG